MPFAGLPALHPATPFEKGVDPKTFLRMGNTLFMERHRIRNAGTMDFREPIYGLRSPSPLWVFCAFVQAGQSPCTKHRQTVRLRLYALKKVFEGSKGRFFKNAPLAGRGTASPGWRPPGCAGQWGHWQNPSGHLLRSCDDPSGIIAYPGLKEKNRFPAKKHGFAWKPGLFALCAGQTERNLLQYKCHPA